MRKISGQVLSTKPVSLSQAAHVISRFAAFNDGCTPVSLYLKRTAEAFSNLVQFHKKPLHNLDVGDKPDWHKVQKLQLDWQEKNLDGGKGQDCGTRGNEDGKDVAGVVETDPRVSETKALSNGGEEKKKTEKKRKSESVDSGSKKSSKKRKTVAPDS